MTRLILVVLTLLLFSCQFGKDKATIATVGTNQILTCPYSIFITDSLAIGVYEGPEFVEGKDIAHQLSNAIANELGAFLKQSFLQKKYLKIDFNNAKVWTETPYVLGEFPDSSVRYSIVFPLIKVENPKHSFTGIEHRGSWIGKITEKDFKQWQKRMRESLIKGKDEWQLFKTKEGFAEYWLQFQHKDFEHK